MSAADVLSVSRGKAEVLFHGLPYFCFDRTNNLALWAIARMFIDGFLIPKYESVFTEYKDLFHGTNNMLFTVHMSCKLTPLIHLVSKYRKYQVLATATMFNLGKTSYMMEVMLSNYNTEELWGKFYIKLVHINGKSRRPEPLPDWYIERFADIVDTQRHLPPISSFPDVPYDAYSMTVKTRYSDLDINKHVTTAQYINFFTDCATHAVFANYYTHFKHDMSWYPVTAFDITFLGESRADEFLTVSTWQDKNDVTRVFFACVKDKKYVLKAVFIYSQTKKKPKLPPHF